MSAYSVAGAGAPHKADPEAVLPNLQKYLYLPVIWEYVHLRWPQYLFRECHLQRFIDPY